MDNLQGRGNGLQNKVLDLVKFQQRAHLPADILQKLLIIILSPEKKLINNSLHFCSDGIKQENYEQGKNKRKKYDVALARSPKEQMKEINNHYIEEG